MFEDITRASHRERREMVAEILADALYQIILQGRGPKRSKDGRPPAAGPVAVAPPPRVEPGPLSEPEAA